MTSLVRLRVIEIEGDADALLPLVDRLIDGFVERGECDFMADFARPLPGLAFFELGDARLLIERGAAPSQIYLEVPDIESAYAALGTAGVELVDPPHLIFRDDQGTFGTPGIEEWMAFFKDSEGNLVGLVERRP